MAPSTMETATTDGHHHEGRLPGALICPVMAFTPVVVA